MGPRSKQIEPWQHRLVKRYRRELKKRHPEDVAREDPGLALVIDSRYGFLWDGHHRAAALALEKVKRWPAIDLAQPAPPEWYAAHPGFPPPAWEWAEEPEWGLLSKRRKKGGKGTRAKKNMNPRELHAGDRGFRELERRALSGDPDAHRRYVAEWYRRGLAESGPMADQPRRPTLEDFNEEWVARVIAPLGDRAVAWMDEDAQTSWGPSWDLVRTEESDEYGALYDYVYAHLGLPGFLREPRIPPEIRTPADLVTDRIHQALYAYVYARRPPPSPNNVLHFEDYAEECNGPPGWTTGAPELVTCADCQQRLVGQNPPRLRARIIKSQTNRTQAVISAYVGRG
jgi:hypothetical protein